MGFTAVSAVGMGGQYIFTVPELDLIIIMTGEPYTSPEINMQREFFPLGEMIIDSIVE